MEKFVRLYTKM